LKRYLPTPFFLAVLLSIVLHVLLGTSFKWPNFTSVESVPDVVIKTKIASAPIVKPKEKVKTVQNLLD